MRAAAMDWVINVDRDHIQCGAAGFLVGLCFVIRKREVSFPLRKLAKKIAKTLSKKLKEHWGASWVRFKH